jgi:hypothetical protein
MTSPGCNAIFKGSSTADEDDELAKPGEGLSDADAAVITLWSNWGFVVDVYCPGRSKRLAAAPGAEMVAPTVELCYMGHGIKETGGRTCRV